MEDGGVDAHLCAQSSEEGAPQPGKLKWLKFDDEFVNALPATSSSGLHNSIVSGRIEVFIPVILKHALFIP